MFAVPSECGTSEAAHSLSKRDAISGQPDCSLEIQERRVLVTVTRLILLAMALFMVIFAVRVFLSRR